MGKAPLLRTSRDLLTELQVLIEFIKHNWREHMIDTRSSFEHTQCHKPIDERPHILKMNANREVATGSVMPRSKI